MKRSYHTTYFVTVTRKTAYRVVADDPEEARAIVAEAVVAHEQDELSIEWETVTVGARSRRNP